MSSIGYTLQRQHVETQKVEGARMLWEVAQADAPQLTLERKTVRVTKKTSGGVEHYECYIGDKKIWQFQRKK